MKLDLCWICEFCLLHSSHTDSWPGPDIHIGRQTPGKKTFCLLLKKHTCCYVIQCVSRLKLLFECGMWLILVLKGLNKLCIVYTTPGAIVIDQGFLGRIGISSCLSLAATNELLFGSSANFIRITIITFMNQNQSHNP